jgi:diacylglycerol kinase (ATP)
VGRARAPKGRAEGELGLHRLGVVFNPESGGGEFRRTLPALLELLRAQGVELLEFPTTHVGHAIELARAAVAAGVEAVCAIGGDGTVNEVINGIADTGVPLLVVPTGTVNVLAMELGIPLEPADACLLASQGHLSSIDLGLAGERYFALMAGVGLDAMVVNSLNPALKKALKEAAFAVHGLATFFRSDFPKLRVETAEQTTEGYFVVIGNAANYSGSFGITTKASMRDGLLDVCVLQTPSPLGTAYYWLAALVESHLRSRHVRYWRTEEVRVAVAEGDAEVLVQTDGEVAGKLPLVCRVVPRALRVIVP